jgi:hypothetical protein
MLKSLLFALRCPAPTRHDLPTPNTPQILQGTSSDRHQGDSRRWSTTTAENARTQFPFAANPIPGILLSTHAMSTATTTYTVRHARHPATAMGGRRVGGDGDAEEGTAKGEEGMGDGFGAMICWPV